MTNKKIIQTSAGIMVSAVMLFGSAAIAFAQDTNTTSDQNAGSTSSSVVSKKSEHRKASGVKAKLNQSTMVDKADKEINKRLDDLAKIESRIGDMKNMTEAQKTELSNSIDTEKTALNSLMTKIGNDTDPTTLKGDVKSITEDNRVYALIIPQVKMNASADKAQTIINMYSALATKLQARIAEVKATGKDVTDLNNTLADLNTNLSEATSLLSSIPSGVNTLSPDKGSKTVMESNKLALKTAGQNLAKVNAYIASAKKDVKKIMSGVKGVGASATSTTTSVPVQSDAPATTTGASTTAQ
jgi:hypothetical protein